MCFIRTVMQYDFHPMRNGILQLVKQLLKNKNDRISLPIGFFLLFIGCCHSPSIASIQSRYAIPHTHHTTYPPSPLSPRQTPPQTVL